MRNWCVIAGLFAMLFMGGCSTERPSFGGSVEGRNRVNVINDTVIFFYNNHAAFTSLETWKGDLYVAFREGGSHVASTDDKGKIIVLKQTKNGWMQQQVFAKDGVDLRDPFLLNWNGELFLYSVGYYSILRDNGWMPLAKIKHNAPHYLNIWKMREYKGVLYGVGNAYKQWPILLTSNDGINWNVKDEFRLGGNASEADMCFINDNMYICIRVDEPAGSLSFWGRGEYPFNEIKWTVMDISVASPELMVINSNEMLLAGREYDRNAKDGSIGRYMSVFTINNKGEVLGKYRISNDSKGDKGYPSFCHFPEKYYMSYYTGILNTKIKIMEFDLK